jgi:hypothetical protein
MWWLGLLYRKPMRFVDALAELPERRQLLIAGELLLHPLPYLLVVSVVGRGLLVWAGITFSISLWDIASGIAIGIAGGIAVGIAFGIALLGTALRIALGISVVIAFGIALGITFGISLGIALGIALGIVFRIAVGAIGAWIQEGVRTGLADGYFIGTGLWAGLTQLIGFVIGAGFTVGIVFLAGGIAFWIAFLITVARVYYHPMHFWFVWPAIRGRLYPWHPVAWDDLCAVPFPGLGRLLVSYAEVAPEAAEAEIERLIDTYPSQKYQALIARTILLARAAAAETDLSRLDQMVDGIPEGEKGFLGETARVKAMIGEIAALQRQLDTMDRPAFREPVAANLKDRIEIFRDKIAGFALASEFRRAADKWLAIAQRQHDRAKAQTTRESRPQVFRAGEPVESDTEAFVPRMPIIEQLEGQIMLATGCPGLLIGGRRRMGKSTLIRNLSGFIPESVKAVPISMQQARAFTSLAYLCDLIADEVGNAAGLTKRPASDDPPLVQLFDQLTDANRALATGEQRLLLAIDEFEKIDAKIGEGVFPTDLLSTVRESIQSHRRIIWAFVGVGDLNELTHASWSSYFVGLRSITVPPFTAGETQRLLTEPLAQSRLWRARAESAPRFDSSFWGNGGIERIQTEAGGWPHLVQLLAETAVELANNQQLAALDAGLLEQAIDEAVERGTVVLSELIEKECRTPAEWQFLLGFRATETQPPPPDEQIRRSLRRRLLIVEEDEQWRLRAPLMRRWLIKYA